jgi:threonine aldolase
MKAITDCNFEHMPSYGTDSITLTSYDFFKTEFGPATEVLYVFNGTACNVLALKLMCKRHESVICSDVSHLNQDECGAPEFFVGKLQTVPSDDGKMKLEDIKKTFVRRGDQHFSQSRVISLTQPTELGTCYSIKEIHEICDWAHNNGLFVHMDGARLSNALIELKCSFKEMTTECGVDAVSFGGTKNGLMMGEAILILNPNLAATAKSELKYIRKQSAQLPSKTRYIAAQFQRYFQDKLYLEIASQSCGMAENFFQKLKQIPEVKITRPRQSNAVFAVIPQKYLKKLRDKYFFYVWDEKTFECRLMTSWDTKEEEIDGFINLLKSMS